MRKKAPGGRRPPPQATAFHPEPALCQPPNTNPSPSWLASARASPPRHEPPQTQGMLEQSLNPRRSPHFARRLPRRLASLAKPTPLHTPSPNPALSRPTNTIPYTMAGERPPLPPLATCPPRHVASLKETTSPTALAEPPAPQRSDPAKAAWSPPTPLVPRILTSRRAARPDKSSKRCKCVHGRR